MIKSGHLIEDNWMLRPGRGFRSYAATGGLFGNANKQKAAADALARKISELNIRYPYPPADCEAALATIANLKDEINSLQEKTASGVLKQADAAIQENALHQVLNQFQAYVNKKQCVKKIVQGEDDQFYAQVQAALANENKPADAAVKKNNLLMFGIIGLLAVGTLVIVLKK